MLNRSVVPDFQPIEKLSLVAPDRNVYLNGLESFVFQAPELDLLKFEFMFKNVYEEKASPLLNPVLSAMLKEGTSTLTSAQIARQVDFYGAFLMPEFSFDHTSLTLYTMHKHVDKVLPLVSSILRDSIFPVHELETHIRNNKQSLQISLQKNEVIARRTFFKTIFGEGRYGNLPTADGYEAVTREGLLDLYKKQITPRNCTLMIAGNVDQSVLNSVTDFFGNEWLSDAVLITDVVPDFANFDPVLQVENREDSLQSAIRIGGVSIRRSHVDFPAVQFVNTLFGGYFGSRLMKNIREDKGYTYNIGSSVGNLKHAGFFTLASEVGVDVTQNTLDEIQKEFEVLCQEKTSLEEVDLVRNYMQGVALGSLESIFSHMDKFKTVYFSGLDLTYYDYYSDVIATMDSEKVQDIAIKYFNYNLNAKIVVGKLN